MPDANEIERDALDRFGQALMQRVRDRAILELDMLVDGRMKGKIGEEIGRLLQSNGSQESQAIQRLIPEAVDRTLFHLLWTLEQEEWMDVAVRASTGVVPSLRRVSDGLSSELWGWILEWSQQRYVVPEE